MSDGLAALSEGTQRALALEGISTRTRLAAMPTTKLKCLPGIGPTRLREIERFLDGMTPLSRQAVERAIFEALRGDLDPARAWACASTIMARLRDLGIKTGKRAVGTIRLGG